MKIGDFIQHSSSLLIAMQDAGIQTSDVKYLNLYDKYKRMKLEENKKTYIIAVLSDNFKLSERQIERIINKLDKDI